MDISRSRKHRTLLRTQLLVLPEGGQSLIPLRCPDENSSAKKAIPVDDRGNRASLVGDTGTDTAPP